MAEIDLRMEDEGAAKLPRELAPPGAPSILYFIDNIPADAEKLKFVVISHFQKRKRFKGGEVVEKEYKALGPNSALLLFENAEEVSQLQTVPHCINDQEVELHPLVKERVTIEMGGPSFFQTLISSDEMTQLIGNEGLLLIKRNDSYAISGNWISVQNFRKGFQQFMINKLKERAREDLSILFSSTGETTESPVHPKPEDPKLEAIEDVSSDGSISAKGSSLNPDVLALMQKTGAYKHPALSYDLQTATININCDDPTEKEKVKEELFTAYRELMMGGKLKEHTLPVEDVQQASAMVDECNKTFNHTYFRYDPEKKEIKCLSTDARQMQNVRRRLNVMKKDPKIKSVFIDLPKKSRRVTIKLGDIIEEEVDVIVNAANDRLMHAGGVAAAIDRASYGAVQRESNKVIEQTGTLPTGEAVITRAGGKLKCEFVVHAVGPIATKHKDQCGPLLRNACVNSMIMAQHNKAKSISFPPISSGLFGVPKELVANVMLPSLCSYTCSDPELLNDVRIVIIDEPTFDVFLKFFHKERANLELLQHAIPTTISKSTTYHHSMQVGNSPQLVAPNSLTNLVSIDLPKLARRITIKLGDIVQERVDVIVNAANMQLLLNVGVGAAIDKASGGVVQRECKKIISSTTFVHTGDAVATTAGGTLKCNLVIHAVGPIASTHKNQCGSLLKKACISAMNVATNFEAISVAFPPISSGNCGVSTELVASVMLSTLCSYKCSNPALLNDVRIVIIDKPTFEIFLNVFKEQQSLDQVYNNSTIASGVLKPPTFQFGQSAGNLFSSEGATKFPGHVQPVSYSQAVTQQSQETKDLTSGGFDPQPTNPSQPNGQDYSQAMPGTSSDAIEKHRESSLVMNEPQDDPNDPNNAHGDLQVTSSSTNADEENAKSMDNDNTEDGKHGEDVPIDSYKTPSNEDNKENSSSNDFVLVRKPSGYNSSVDLDANLNPPPDNTNLSLQPASGDPLDLTKNLEETSDELHSPASPEALQNSADLTSKQRKTSITLHTKHLPATTHGGQTSLQNSENKDKSKGKKNDENAEDCPICFDKLKNQPVTAITNCKYCKQAFCKGCLDEALKHKPYCPTCTVPLRKVTGNQPVGGTMMTHTYQHQKLPGYEAYGTIQIHYDIPSGRQGKEHPNPGHHFTGTSRIAYVPDSPEGRKVVQLLRKAFDAQLIFTIGTSHTSGATNAVVWNDIHHKTSTQGGPTNYGYPDPTYLSRVLEELAAKGIKE